MTHARLRHAIGALLITVAGVAVTLLTSCGTRFVGTAPQAIGTQAPAVQGSPSTRHAETAAGQSSGSQQSGTQTQGSTATSSGGVTGTFPSNGTAGEISNGTAVQSAGNPFAGAYFYLNPEYVANVEASKQRADAALQPAIERVKSLPNAVWLDRIAAIAGASGRLGLKGHIEEGLRQLAGVGKADATMVMSFVVYDLPGRDCAAFASNGELPANAAGLARYKADYIDAIAGIISDPSYKKIRFVLFIEPDSLPNLITNLGIYETCRQASDFYKQGVTYALTKLSSISNVSLYLDIAHSGWLGWEHTDKAVQLYKEILQPVGGLNVIRGFALNIANYTPFVEPFNPFGDVNVNRSIIEGFYEWNRMIDENTYLQKLQAGFPGKSFVIDTGRNGWKIRGANLPRDARTHRGNWCNPTGAGIGERPAADPQMGVDAFFFVKAPGESDGTSDSTATAANADGKRFDKMCAPGAVERPYAPGRLIATDALSGAPHAGEWFHEQFLMLVRNATPPL